MLWISMSLEAGSLILLLWKAGVTPRKRRTRGRVCCIQSANQKDTKEWEWNTKWSMTKVSIYLFLSLHYFILYLKIITFLPTKCTMFASNTQFCSLKYTIFPPKCMFFPHKCLTFGFNLKCLLMLIFSDKYEVCFRLQAKQALYIHTQMCSVLVLPTPKRNALISSTKQSSQEVFIK